MDREKLKELLLEIGLDGGRRGGFKDSGDNVQFCCPFHNERKPSAGIHVENLIGKCFGCDERFNLARLVSHCLKIKPEKAVNWIEERLKGEKISLTKSRFSHLREYDEREQNSRFELPKLKLAPFKSGKVTHQYFYDRGFTTETVKKFNIGWDTTRNRVTIPVFWQGGELCGVIGRAILNEYKNDMLNLDYLKLYYGKNSPKYYIYYEFPIGEILFPLNHFKPINGTAILVEGTLDALWLHQLGFTNALSTITARMSFSKNGCPQKKLLEQLGVDTIILMKDNDKAGKAGAFSDYTLLKKDFRVYNTEYPEGAKDPCDLSLEQIVDMLDNKEAFSGYRGKLVVKRL